MTQSNPGASRRLERLERVFTGRRARLAQALDREQRRAAHSGPIGSLQRYGYPVALLLVATAVLPTAIGLAFRRRKLLVGAAANALGLWKLRKRFDSARRTEGGR